MYHRLRVRTTAVRQVWLLARPYWALLAPGAACAIASSGVLLGLPALFGQALTQLPQVELPLWGGLAGLVALQAAAAYGATYWLGLVAARAVIDLRQRVYVRLIAMPVAAHDRRWSADSVSALMSDALFIEHALGTLVPTAIQHGPIVALVIVILLVHNWLLTLWLIIAGVPLLIFTLLVGRALRRVTRDAQQTLGSLSIVAQESLLGLRTIKSLAREPFFVERFGALSARLYAFKRRRTLWQAALEAAIPLAAVVMVVCSSFIVRWQIQAGQLSPAALVTYCTYCGLLAVSLLRLLRAYTGFEHVLGAAQRIAALHAVPIEQLPPAPDRISATPATIRFEAVSFAYADGRAGVHDIALTIAPGEVVALVGANGAGKSTLVHLLLRFYEPQQGRISLDGRGPDQIDLATWRRNFALMSRDPTTFWMSIADNIRLGDPTASQAAIERAAAAVGLHAFIQQLPQGYATLVGEAGVQLSSGQRQRLALARIFLQDPQVVILDEATTSIDTESERLLTEALRAWIGRRTVLLISHTPRGWWPVTRVVHVAQGRIVADEPRVALEAAARGV